MRKITKPEAQNLGGVNGEGFKAFYVECAFFSGIAVIA
jgi:hypothetical protein